MTLSRLRLWLTAFASVGLFAAPAEAQETPEAPPAPATSEAPDRTASPHPFPRYFLHASFGLNAFTYTGASGKTPSSTITTADKTIVYQQVGVGYWVHPNIRLQLTGIFGETLSGLKPGQNSLSLAGVIPCVLYTNGGLFAGGGPLFAPRAFGTDGFNVGLFSIGGYAFQLGAGMSLAAAVQVPVMFAQKESVAVTPAAILGERF